MIHLAGVHKVHARGSTETRALDGIDLDIAAGSFVSCMGPSGSGKSTLLHLLGALDRPTRGVIELDGVALGSLDDAALTRLRRTRLGFIFQSFNLLATMTALENAMLPALLAGRSWAAASRAATDLLVSLDLEARLQHRPEAMSGGEVQRTAIARALVNGPAVVLADEPTGALDSANGQQVLRLLRQRTAERQVTVVMVTHDAAAAAVGDRILRLQDGRIVGDAATVGAASAPRP